MNRKNFLRSTLGTLAALPVKSLSDGFSEEPRSIVTPPYLQSNDSIGICAPGGYVDLIDLEPAIQRLKEWGFSTKIGSRIGRRDFSMGGTDEERLSDFQELLNDRSVKAILCARGGYGSVRIIDRLDFTQFEKYPKWIIGFSDITVFHSHLHQHLKVASIHAKMCNSFPSDWAMAEPLQRTSIESIRDCLTGKKMIYESPYHSQQLSGKCSGLLVGGNLKTIESLSASVSDISTKGKILFLEDTGEYLYSIDRMFWNVLRSGKLQNLAGLIIGGFKIKQDEPGEEFGRSLQEIILEKVRQFGYPVAFDFPVGHQKHNMALKCGIMHQLDVSSSSVTLTEI